MIGELPESLEIGGKNLPINADFRNILRIFEAFSDAELTDEEKAFVCIKRLFIGKIPPEHTLEAVKKAYDFCGGNIPVGEQENAKIIDWEHDGNMIFPAVSKSLGVVDVRSLPFLHWWSFLGSFGEMGEGLFVQVVHIRRKMVRGKKLEKYEKEFLRQHKNLVMIDDEQADFAELSDFLRRIT